MGRGPAAPFSKESDRAKFLRAVAGGRQPARIDCRTADPGCGVVGRAPPRRAGQVAQGALGEHAEQPAAPGYGPAAARLPRPAPLVAPRPDLDPVLPSTGCAIAGLAGKDNMS